MFHLMMIVPAALLLLLSLISLGTLAATNNEFVELNGVDSGACILYAQEDSDAGPRRLEFAGGNQCRFTIAGDAILAAIAVILSVVFIVKAVLGVGV